MPPINQRSTLKNLNTERKQEKKRWKEQKLLKAAAGFMKDVEGVKNREENQPDSSCSDYVNGNLPERSAPSYTISIAVPASILDNAQSPELKTYLAGQIARAACIYRVNEIVVFDDIGSQNNNGIHEPGEDSCQKFARLLQYLECPQYLRRFLFPLHKHLQYVGVLNPLDAPHHLRQSDDFPFREGVVSHHLVKQGKGCYVNVGLRQDICVDKALIPDVRVTVRMLPQKDGSKKRYGQVVSPETPYKELGVYWGYSVRIASSLSDVFVKAPYDEGYDLTIGTSDKGEPIEDCSHSDFANFKHTLIVFGGLEGLESALECDDNLTIDDVKLLFDKYLNTCLHQGSRTIRTEEAVLISLAQITTRINAAIVEESNSKVIDANISASD